MNTNIMNQTNSFILSPGYITGLVQTDGSFFCTIALSTKHRFGLQFRPKFTITADLNSKYVLISILNYFSCGNITENIKNHTAEFEVTRIEELYKIIIPHFNKYPLFCSKLHAFNLFSKIVYFLFNKEKRTLEGRRELLKMALSMNATTNRTEKRLDLLFSLLSIKTNKDKKLILNTIKTVDTVLSNDNIAGIIDGDGSFYVNFNKDGSIKTGFSITSDILSMPLLKKIKEQFKGIGTIYKGSRNELRYVIKGINQINKILIPFVDLNPLFSERALHYEKFKFVSKILNNEKPLSLENKLKIVELAYNANKEGKHRKLTKAQYIKLLNEIYNK
jgi:hypothetical protein